MMILLATYRLYRLLTHDSDIRFFTDSKLQLTREGNLAQHLLASWLYEL